MLCLVKSFMRRNDFIAQNMLKSTIFKKTRQFFSEFLILDIDTDLGFVTCYMLRFQIINYVAVKWLQRLSVIA